VAELAPHFDEQRVWLKGSSHPVQVIDDGHNIDRDDPVRVLAEIQKVRIHVEERTLSEALGEPYRRLFPGCGASVQVAVQRSRDLLFSGTRWRVGLRARPGRRR
jgi:hypothetical protein